MLRLALIALIPMVFAQVESPGAPRSHSTDILPPAQVDLSAQAPDVAQLLAQDVNASKSAFRVGAVIDHLAALEDFSATLLPDGTLHRLEVTSPGALGMGVNFAQFDLPAGATLHMYTPDRTKVRGAFTSANHKHYGGFAISPVPGPTLVLEVFVPSGGVATVRVESFVHHYKNTAVKSPGEQTLVQGQPPITPGSNCVGCSGSCNVNFACPLGDGWENQAAGVVRILTANGGSLCTGSFINNVESDGRQLFLTANHCGGGNADGWILMFDFETSTCNDDKSPSTDRTVQGTRLLALKPLEDFVLLEITEQVPDSYNVYFSGFNAQDDFEFKVPYSISHPSGDVKKVAIFNGEAVPSGYFGVGVSHWIIAEWDKGVTEGGSSGSPIFDDMKRIRGQLHGGAARCGYAYEDYYGRLSQSWSSSASAGEQLAIHLDPKKTGIKVVDGMLLSAARAKTVEATAATA